MLNRYLLASVLLFVIGTASAAEAPKPDPLQACQVDLAVVAQFAAQQRSSRNELEQELARARAQIAALQARISQLDPKGPKSISPPLSEPTK